MKYLIVYFFIGLIFAFIKTRMVGFEIESNPAYIKFRYENPVRYRVIYRVTMVLGFVINTLLWPVVIIGDWFIARKGKGQEK